MVDCLRAGLAASSIAFCQSSGCLADAWFRMDAVICISFLATPRGSLATHSSPVSTSLYCGKQTQADHCLLYLPPSLLDFHLAHLPKEPLVRVAATLQERVLGPINSKLLLLLLVLFYFRFLRHPLRAGVVTAVRGLAGADGKSPVALNGARVELPLPDDASMGTFADLLLIEPRSDWKGCVPACGFLLRSPAAFRLGCLSPPNVLSGVVFSGCYRLLQRSLFVSPLPPAFAYFHVFSATFVSVKLYQSDTEKWDW